MFRKGSVVVAQYDPALHGERVTGDDALLQKFDDGGAAAGVVSVQNSEYPLKPVLPAFPV